jgi:hypothetical protein
MEKKLRLDKLIDATNLDWDEENKCWKKNEKVFEIARRIERELSPFPEFVGVFPFGSRTKGYADENIIEPKSGMTGSDYDMYIFEDTGLKEGERTFDILFEMGTEYRHQGIKIEFLGQFLSMKNLFSLFEIADIIDSDYVVLQWFSNLCRSGVGQKIKEWQKKIREEILKLPKEKRDQMLELFSDCLVNRDKKTLSKMAERIRGFNKDEWLDARRALWTKRVYKRFAGIVLAPAAFKPKKTP